MATPVACTVDTGGTGDYPSLNAAEAANFGASNANLTVSDEYCVCTCRCTGGTADTTAFVVSGQTTDATHYILIQVDSAYRHNGTYPASGNYYRHELTYTGTTSGLSWMNYVTLRGVAFQITLGGNWLNTLTATGGLVWFEDCIFLCVPGAYENSIIFGFNGSAGTTYLRNCIFSGATGTGNKQVADGGSGQNAVIHSCTFANATNGAVRSAGTFTLKNCIFSSVTTDVTGSFDAASTNNIGGAAATMAFGATRTTGTTTSATAGKLNDTNKNFNSLGVRVGSVIKNTTDTTYTYVTAVDSATVLSVNDDIFANGEEYAIYYNLKGSPTFRGASDFHLAGGRSDIAFRTGADLDEDATLPVTDDINGNSRHATTPCIGADEYLWVDVTGAPAGKATIAAKGTVFIDGVGTSSAAGVGATVWLGRMTDRETGRIRKAVFWARHSRRT